MHRFSDRWFFGLCAVLAALGLFLKFALTGHDFLGLICFGLLALLVCFRLLIWLGQKRPKLAKILTAVLCVCVSLGLCTAIITGFFIARAGIGEPDGEYAYVVVLGAGVNGTEPSLSLRNRLDAAYAYMTDHPETVCIVSGAQGSGEDISEAQCMFDDLVARGIDPERIWMEDRATSTKENLAYSLTLIEERTGTRPEEIGLISAEYHLFRAGLFAREEGVLAHGIPGKTTWFSLFLNYFFREIVAVWHHILLD